MGNRKIDVIIPAYNVPSSILFRCLSSIGTQDIIKDIEVTIVDDASTKQNYAKVAKMFSKYLKVNILRYETNGGPGVARQYGLDHTTNEYVTFIDADDTFNGSFALKALRTGIELNGGKYQMCVGIFDEIIEHNLPKDIPGPVLIEHANDMVWMFGKLYRRNFIDRNKICFHPTSRANEDNGFNTICRFLLEDQGLINFIPAHVYYWHENPNSITRINNGQYTYGGSERDSNYGYIENMIYALQYLQKRNPNHKKIHIYVGYDMVHLYQHYIECLNRSPLTLENNLKWYQRFYKEIYIQYEDKLTRDILNEIYNDVMRNAYGQNTLEGIIPSVSFFEFLNKCKD